MAYVPYKGFNVDNEATTDPNVPASPATDQNLAEQAVEAAIDALTPAEAALLQNSSYNNIVIEQTPGAAVDGLQHGGFDYGSLGLTHSNALFGEADFEIAQQAQFQSNPSVSGGQMIGSPHSNPDMEETTLHEFGHAMDDLLGETQPGNHAQFSETSTFLSQLEKDRTAIQNDHSLTESDRSELLYYADHPNELFAELFAVLHGAKTVSAAPDISPPSR